MKDKTELDVTAIAALREKYEAAKNAPVDESLRIQVHMWGQIPALLDAAERLAELKKANFNQDDTIRILQRQIAGLESEIKGWAGNANSVRRVCKEAGIPTHHGGHYEGVPRDLVDPVKDLLAERNRMRGALRLIADTEHLTFAECSDAERIISTAKDALSAPASAPASDAGQENR